MSEEVKDKMLEVAKILFKYNVPIEQAKFIGDFIETQNNQLQQKENIIKEYGDLDNHNKYLYEENKRLENIIKEVREILNQDKASASFNTAERIALEILDKGE